MKTCRREPTCTPSRHCTPPEPWPRPSVGPGRQPPGLRAVWESPSSSPAPGTSSRSTPWSVPPRAPTYSASGLHLKENHARLRVRQRVQPIDELPGEGRFVGVSPLGRELGDPVPVHGEDKPPHDELGNRRRGLVGGKPLRSLLNASVGVDLRESPSRSGSSLAGKLTPVSESRSGWERLTSRVGGSRLCRG